MDYSEKWGVDVEEAVRLALIDLKVSREEVEVTVLEEPSKGFFGIGSKLAKVRVEIKKKEEEIPEPVFIKEEIAEVQTDIPQEQPHERPHEKSNQKGYRENKERRERKPVKKNKAKKDKINKDHVSKSSAGSHSIEVVNKEELEDVETHEALDFLREITDKMGLSLNFKVKAGKNVVYIEMDGADSGTVIGKRGQTLDAIQYLTSLVINKDSEKYIKVVVDAENYRAKRQKTLEQLANRLANKVIKTGKYVRLEPMNPYERKVIHATLQHNSRIITRSEGEEPYRKVVIELKK